MKSSMWCLENSGRCQCHGKCNLHTAVKVLASTFAFVLHDRLALCPVCCVQAAITTSYGFSWPSSNKALYGPCFMQLQNIGGSQPALSVSRSQSKLQQRIHSEISIIDISAISAALCLKLQRPFSNHKRLCSIAGLRSNLLP